MPNIDPDQIHTRCGWIDDDGRGQCVDHRYHDGNHTYRPQPDNDFDSTDHQPTPTGWLCIICDQPCTPDDLCQHCNDERQPA